MLYNKILTSASFFVFLFKVDNDLARKAKTLSCSHCGGRLDQANYLRKPRGGTFPLSIDFSLKYSLCCRQDGCRKRTDVPTLRFLGRFVYNSLWILLASYFLGPGKSRVSRLQKLLSIDRRTLMRWKEFWQEEFPFFHLRKILQGWLPEARIFPRDVVAALDQTQEESEFVLGLTHLFKDFGHLR